MKIVNSNGEYRFYNKIEILDKLEPKNYILKYNMFGMYLEEVGDFSLPEKLYDVEQPFRDLVLKSFHASKRNTGVLLEGYKGQGKTITAKLLTIEAKLPVIIIEASIPQNINFISFLNDIQQEYILFVDEFEKIFKKAFNSNMDDVDASKGFHNQEAFLTLMDGALSNEYKKLFLFTTNDSVDDKFINRPSRIKWHKPYQFMDKKMYDLILNDKLKIQEFREDLERNLPVQEATVDLLTTIIEQVNDLGLPYSEFKAYFNHQAKNLKYTISLIKEGEETKELGKITLTSAPIRETAYIDSCYVHEVVYIDEDTFVFKTPYIHSRHKLEEGEKRPSLNVYKVTKVVDFVEKMVF